MSKQKCVIQADNKISQIVEPVKLPFEISNAVFNEVSYTPSSAFWANAYRSGKWNGKIYLYNYRNQTFPTGCMNRVREKLIENDFDVGIKDIRKKPEPNETWNLVRHRWDRPNEDFALRWFQKEAVEKARRTTRGIFSLPTGCGKTTTFTATIADLKVSPVLVIVPTIDLLYQTKYEIENMLEDKGKPIEVGFVGDSKVNIKEITICIINSALHAYDMYFDSAKKRVLKIDAKCSKTEQKQISEIQKYKYEIRNLIENCKMVVCDETHRSASDMYKSILLQCNAYYRLGYSATPQRVDGKELEIEAAFGRIIMDIPLKQMIEEDVLMDPQIYMVAIDYDPDGANIVKQETFIDPETNKKEKIEAVEWLPAEDWTYQDTYKTLVVENSELNNKIAGFAEKFNNMGYSVLVLVKEYAHGDTLEELIPGSIFLKGKDTSKIRKETIQKIKDKTLMTLIATSIADMGLDLPTLDCLILAGSGGSDPTKYQAQGYKRKNIAVSKGASNWLDIDPVDREIAEMMDVDATEGLDEVRFGGVIEQRIGRVLRKSPGKDVAIVIDFWFKNSKIRNQSKARKKVYLSRGLKVKMIK